jgi:hypothetical protein
MPQPFDDDSTIRLTKPGLPPVRPRRAPWWMIAAPIGLVAATVLGGWLFWGSSEPPATPPVAMQPAPSAPQPSTTEAPPTAVTPPVSVPASISTPEPAPAPTAFSIETATEQQILDHIPADGAPDPMVFRFKANPRILILDFTSLLDQGRMLNRVAALSEKTGLPHDRLLSDSELDTAILAGGDTVETFYYGHDYGASELLRFFALSDRDDIRLMSQEDNLRRLIRQDGWFEPDVRAALISIPQVGADAHVTRSARTTILHHELSHGEYFTNPHYAAFAHRFWTRTLTAAERDRIRSHLHALGYDSSLEEVMENEAQAYLMFTDSAEFFTPEAIGMSKARLAELRKGFLATMPAGWLHDSLGQALSGNKATATMRP